MSTYKIPIVWQCIKTYEVTADNLQDAVEKALGQFFSEPDDGYIEDSVEVDEILHDNYPGEDYDTNKAFDKL